MRPIAFDLDVLRSFASGMDLGSFAKAADRLKSGMHREPRPVAAQVRRSPLVSVRGLPVAWGIARPSVFASAADTGDQGPLREWWRDRFRPRSIWAASQRADARRAHPRRIRCTFRRPGPERHQQSGPEFRRALLFAAGFSSWAAGWPPGRQVIEAQRQAAQAPIHLAKFRHVECQRRKS